MEHDRLTREETAHLCRVSVSTLERWARAGIGPKPIKMGPRLVRYIRDEVDQYRSTKRSA